MSNSTKKDASGALFKAKPGGKEGWPEYEGSCMVGGVEYWLSGWIREGAKSGKFFSLAFKPKVARAEAPAARPQSPAADMSDDIPFAPRGMHD